MTNQGNPLGFNVSMFVPFLHQLVALGVLKINPNSNTYLLHHGPYQENHQMGVSKNNGTPKSSIVIGFSIINNPFWGVYHPYFWKHPNLPVNFKQLFPNPKPRCVFFTDAIGNINCSTCLGGKNGRFTSNRDFNLFLKACSSSSSWQQASFALNLASKKFIETWVFLETYGKFCSFFVCCF